MFRIEWVVLIAAIVLPSLARIYQIWRLFGNKSSLRLKVGLTTLVSILFVLIWVIAGITSTIWAQWMTYDVFGYAPEIEKLAMNVWLVLWSLVGLVVGLSNIIVISIVWVGLVCIGVIVFCGFIIVLVTTIIFVVLGQLTNQPVQLSIPEFLVLTAGVAGFILAFALPVAAGVGVVVGMGGESFYRLIKVSRTGKLFDFLKG